MSNFIKVFLTVFLCALFTANFSGCATLRKGSLEKQELRNQVQALEAQLRQKEDEISSLRDALDKEKTAREKFSARSVNVVEEVKSRPNVKQIQIALKNAGYSPGLLDGRMGKQTKSAIRAFQKANGLGVDGKVGKETWKVLGQYFYQKVK